IRHHEAVRTDARLERLRRSAIDRAVLAHNRIVADLDCRSLALELEILRIAAENGPDSDLDVPAECHVAFEAGARRYHAAVADHTLLANDRERSDLDAVSELRRWRNYRARMNF